MHVWIDNDTDAQLAVPIIMDNGSYILRCGDHQTSRGEVTAGVGLYGMIMIMTTLANIFTGSEPINQIQKKIGRYLQQ